jgi:mannose-6-phosphate isomerase-like protein (cupin superfamily)
LYSGFHQAKGVIPSGLLISIKNIGTILMQQILVETAIDKSNQKQKIMNNNKSFGISTSEALDRLKREGSDLINLLKVGNVSLDIYKPSGVDRQKPHDRDEIYMIISGKGVLNCDNKQTECKPGDVLYVPAGREHKFERFTNDFCSWAIFTNPANVERMVS